MYSVRCAVKAVLAVHSKVYQTRPPEVTGRVILGSASGNAISPCIHYAGEALTARRKLYCHDEVIITWHDVAKAPKLFFYGGY